MYVHVKKKKNSQSGFAASEGLLMVTRLRYSTVLLATSNAEILTTDILTTDFLTTDILAPDIYATDVLAIATEATEKQQIYQKMA